MVNNEWYYKNELRAFPLKDTLHLREMVVDMSLNIQNCEDVFLTYFRVTNDFVTLSIGSATAALFALTVSKPVRNKTYVLTPLQDNIRGLITLGNLTDVLLETNIMIDPEVVHVTSNIPFTDIHRSVNPANSANHVVGVLAGENIIVENVNGVLTLGLAEGKESTFVPKCSSTPGLTTCGFPLIRSINKVIPDENGRITIEVNNE